ncbi:141R [Yaba monkey tumor virus]|uniref:141R n=1 Tax=Yaba monkey tumor virus (strain VR587) TaxID=928314 RepID=Q6TUN3_YMTV5|nr:Ig domain OX-2-like protein [Yaba monkey tumor virus]AAR07493.1 141R [Yaba monkey tumor virus]
MRIIILLCINITVLFKHLQSTDCFVEYQNSLDAKITCTKISHSNTILITWKKDNKFIAAYGICGPVILNKFKGKIQYLSKSFNESTILVKNVSLLGGCYVCTFNFLPSKNNEKGVVCLT